MVLPRNTHFNPLNNSSSTSSIHFVAKNRPSSFIPYIHLHTKFFSNRESHITDRTAKFSISNPTKRRSQPETQTTTPYHLLMLPSIYTSARKLLPRFSLVGVGQGKYPESDAGKTERFPGSRARGVDDLPSIFRSFTFILFSSFGFIYKAHEWTIRTEFYVPFFSPSVALIRTWIIMYCCPQIRCSFV